MTLFVSVGALTQRTPASLQPYIVESRSPAYTLPDDVFFFLLARSTLMSMAQQPPYWT